MKGEAAIPLPRSVTISGGDYEVYTTAKMSAKKVPSIWTEFSMGGE